METTSNSKPLDSGHDKEHKEPRASNLLVTENQAHLLLVKSETFDLCNSYNFSAASPRGSEVRPISISLTEDAANPTSAPISASVIPFVRRSEMRDAHVLMRPSLRVPVELSQRPSVTEFRQNTGMPRPPNMPREIDITGSIGDRVRWWREHRGMSRDELAEKCGMGNASTLSDLELGNTERGKFLHSIATHLGLNPNYLETGKGEPEEGVPQKTPAAEEWPLSAATRAMLERLNVVERTYMEAEMFKAYAIIEAERKKGRKA